MIDKQKLIDALMPFAHVADGIPDNWPGQCSLAWRQSERGHYYISYEKEGDDAGPKIKEYRNLRKALKLLMKSDVEQTSTNLVLVDVPIMVRLLQGKNVTVEACNVCLIPSADLPHLRDVSTQMRKLAPKKKKR